jgi:ElaB/YqjD/DUF883 family membrane-anchored ribosome-binding protein
MSEYEKYLDNLNVELNFYTRQLAFIKEQFHENTRDDVQNIVDSLHHLLQEAHSSYSKLKSASKEEWEPLKKVAMEAFSQLRASFDDFLHNSSEQAKEYFSQFKEYSAQRLDDLAEYVKEHPFKSLLVAAGVGFIIGKVLK